MITQNNLPLGYYIGYSTDPKLRHKASSGGIGTIIQRHLLSKTDYDTGITFYFDQELCQYVPKIIHSAEEINICGSIYHDINLVTYIRDNLDNIKKGIVLTCAPCQVTAIRQLLNKKQISSFIISYCCSGQTTIEGTWKYYELLGVKKEQVINMQYRGNGWPSGIQIWLKDGSFIKKKNYTEPWTTIHRSWLYRPKKCFFCRRDTGRNADIALADPWLDEYKMNDLIGSTMFLPFTDLGYNLIQELKHKKNIDFVQADYNAYAIAQKSNIEKESRVQSQMSFLRRQASLIDKQWYYQWATKDLNHMQIHIKLMRHLFRVSSRKNFSNFIMNILKRIGIRIKLR